MFCFIYSWNAVSTGSGPEAVVPNLGVGTPERGHGMILGGFEMINRI